MTGPIAGRSRPRAVPDDPPLPLPTGTESVDDLLVPSKGPEARQDPRHSSLGRSRWREIRTGRPRQSAAPLRPSPARRQPTGLELAASNGAPAAHLHRTLTIAAPPFQLYPDLSQEDGESWPDAQKAPGNSETSGARGPIDGCLLSPRPVAHLPHLPDAGSSQVNRLSGAPSWPGPSQVVVRASILCSIQR